MIKRRNRNDDVTHLHWLWKQPQRIGNVSSAIAACGAKGLSKGQWTRYRDDCTCTKCSAVAVISEAPEELPTLEQAVRQMRRGVLR